MNPLKSLIDFIKFNITDDDTLMEHISTIERNYLLRERTFNRTNQGYESLEFAKSLWQLYLEDKNIRTQLACFTMLKGLGLDFNPHGETPVFMETQASMTVYFVPNPVKETLLNISNHNTYAN